MREKILTFFISLITLSAYSQGTLVRGVVIDSSDKLPLIGVNITIEGVPGQATTTNFDGEYQINVNRGSTLVFSYVGYKTLRISATTDQINVSLESDIQELHEVVAIGYGTMRKSDLTGSVASIKADQLQKTPAAGLDQALQGRAAGVTVNANTGQPGAAAQIRIRGIGTVNNSSPIFVVDGMIVNDIAFLSPNDIESTEILKDASATAIYGSRGANGVILVTTKKGKEGKNNISFNSYIGFQNRWKKLDLMKREEFANTIINLNNLKSEKDFFEDKGFNNWLSAYRLGSSPYFPLIQTTANPNGLDYSQFDTDWQDEVFKHNATIQNHYLSFEGGTEKSNYSISASYFKQVGTIIGSDFNRLTLRINTAHQIRNWLKIGENLSFSTSSGRNAMSNNSSPGASILSAALAMAPWDPTHYPEGSVNLEGRNLSNQISASSNFRNVINPFSMVQNSEPSNKSERWLGNIFVEISPIKNLVLRSAVNLDLSNNRDKLFKYAYVYSDYDKAEKNFLSSSMSRYSSIIIENIATYTQEINQHSFSIMGGQTTDEYNYYSINGSGASILNPTANNWYLSQTTDDKSYAGDGVARTRIFSLFGRLHYNYADRYLATFNMRADASSKFPENLWGYFPSLALAWRISEEDFMRNVDFINYLKLRLGWGQIGNDKINSDSFILKMFNEGPSFVDYVFGPDQQLAHGAALLTLVNSGGKWETTEQWNGGLDFGFISQKLTGSLDAFIRDTKEMLLSVKGPAHVGNRFDPVANVGTVRNKGIELTLDYRDLISNTVNYNINGNVSFIKNELTGLNGGDRVYGDRSISDKGYALYTLWGYEYEGIYRSDNEALTHLHQYTAESIPFHEGDARFKDLNEDGIIDDSDKKDLGNPFPWLTYGLNLGADYSGFDIQFFFQGIYGNKIYNALRERLEGKGVEATLGTQMRDAWTANNPAGSIPNPYGTSLNYTTSSRFVESGAYFRLKNIQLGYTLPRELTHKISINRARVYISANNLLTFTKYTGYDPEVGGGVDYGNYPQSRTIMAGVNIDF